MKTLVKVTFGDIKFGKKTILPLEIKGSLTDAQKLALLEFANSDGFVQLASAQKDIEDYEPKPRHDGLKFTVTNGAVEVDSEQLDIDDVISEPERDMPDEENNNEEDEEELPFDEIVDCDYEVVGEDEEEPSEDGWESEETELTDEMEKQVDRDTILII